ncbi:cytochrome P450 [Jackrogersella minutella]|nr:cytochrome P450 [Jackrogersella minutella]
MDYMQTLEVLPLLKLSGVLLLAYLAVSSFATWYRLRHLRGPILARFSYFYMLRILNGDHGKRYHNLYDEYGGDSFLRIGPNDLLENSIIEKNVDEQLEKLVALIRGKYISTESEFRPLDLAPTAIFFAVDTISRIAFGTAFGNLDEGLGIHSFHEFAKAATMKGSTFSEIPWLGKVFFYPPVLRLIGPKVTDKKGVGMFMRFANEIVMKRTDPNAEDKKDMLGSFIRHGVSPEQCKAEIVFQILAGSDTTAHAIRATMLNIITSPRVYVKVRAEIDAAIADGRMPSSPARAEEVKQLPYMQSVIREGLRFSPLAPTTALIQKQVPPEGDTFSTCHLSTCDTFDGHFLPGGTRIAVNILSIQRSEAVFGQDSDCSGKPVAMLELNNVFVELLRHFDFELVSPQSPWKSMNYTLYVVSDFWVRVTEKYCDNY